MRNKTNRLKIITALVMLLETLLVIGFKVIFKINIEFFAYINLAISILGAIYLFICFDKFNNKQEVDITRVLGNYARDAFVYGELGVIVFEDDTYEITWVSEYLQKLGFNVLGQRVMKAIEGIGPLFADNVNSVIIEKDDHRFEVYRNGPSNCIYLREITKSFELEKAYNDERLVMGLINFDNYAETTEHEDEQTIAKINTEIRQKALDWAAANNAVIRKIRNDRFLIICNMICLKKIIDDNFSLLDEVKKASSIVKVNITASMVFATGYANAVELDEAINSLMETVLSRGGDQAAVKENGKEIVYYGLSSESSEKTSKVRARVIARSLDGIIKDSLNVFVVPHLEADMDSFGAALGMDNILKNYDVNSYILFNEISLEKLTASIYKENFNELTDKHNFISENNALEILDDNSLVIIVDHHSPDLTSAPKLVEQAKRIVIIDHHRRKNEAIVESLMIYNEPSASSTVELVTELAQYQKIEVEISKIDASIMYTGLLIDTNNFRVRTSARSFEVCAELKKYGADPSLTNEWLKESVEDYVNKSAIGKMMERYDDIAICALNDEDVYSRTSLAQSADDICTIKGIDASFIIGKVGENAYAISARSTGKVNVQLIMEKMGGGGHFTAAGLQKANTSIDQLKQELLETIELYKQGGNPDESNTIS